MLLVVDAGNTRIKWAAVPERDPLSAACCPPYQAESLLAAPVRLPPWLAQGAVTHDEISRLAGEWQPHGIDAVIVSNVAGSVIEAALRQQFQSLTSAGGVPVTVRWFGSSPMAAGVCNGYREPMRLGCDRMASLVGARALWPGQALIVVTCGTATTIDALNTDGQFIGGLILPGFGMMTASLMQSTAQLSQIRQAQPAAGPQDAMAARLFADNTDDAVWQGCLAAQVGAIERALTRHGNARCILSGGAARWIAPQLTVPPTLVDNLVLIGLEEVVRND